MGKNGTSNRLPYVVSTLCGGLLVFLLIFIGTTNNLRADIEDIRSGKVYAASITPDKLSQDFFTTIKLTLEDGSTIDARIIEGSISTGTPTGNITIQTGDGTLISGTVSSLNPTDTPASEYTIKDGSITENKLSRLLIEKINQERIINNTYSSSSSLEIPDGSIVTIKLADDAVTSAKLADDAVTTSKILDASITGGKLQTGTILSSHLSSNSITTVKIEDGAITTSKILDNVINTDKLQNDSVTTDKIADGTIVDADISASAAIAWTKINKSGSSLADLSDREANDLNLADSGGYYTSTNVEGALQELGSIVSGSFTQGSALFAGVGGVISQDNANFFWDDANNRLGIGTSSPITALDVNGRLTFEGDTGAQLYRVADDNIRATTSFSSATQILTPLYKNLSGGITIAHEVGGNVYLGSNSTATTQATNLILNPTTNVGIGATSPSGKLHIKNTSGGITNSIISLDTTINANASGGLEIWRGAGGTGTLTTRFSMSGSANNYITGSAAGDTIISTSNATNILFGNSTSGAEHMRISSAGNVGIGTNNPTRKLQINTNLTDLTSGDKSTQYIGTNVDTTAGNSLATTQGLYAYVGSSGSNSVSQMEGIRSFAWATNTNGASIVYGLNNNARTSTNTSILAGTTQNVVTHGTGITSNAYGINSNFALNDTSTISSLYHIRLQTPTKAAGATISNGYGLYVNDLNNAISNFAIVTNAGNVVFNEGGDAATNLRVEGDTDANLLYTNASTDRVGIGTTGPTAKLEINGGLRLNTATAKPACDATRRGTIWFVQGSAGVADTFEACRKDAADAYAWVSLY